MNEEMKELATLSEEFAKMPLKMESALERVFKSYGVKTLALWFDPDEYEPDCPQYNEEDMAIMENLTPEYSYVDWFDGGFPDESEGCVIAVEYTPESPNGKFTLILFNCSEECVVNANLRDYSDNSIDLEDLYATIVKSIKFNLENNIPKEKWSVGHFPPVDPYTYRAI